MTDEESTNDPNPIDDNNNNNSDDNNSIPATPEEEEVPATPPSDAEGRIATAANATATGSVNSSFSRRVRRRLDSSSDVSGVINDNDNRNDDDNNNDNDNRSVGSMSSAGYGSFGGSTIRTARRSIASSTNMTAAAAKVNQRFDSYNTDEEEGADNDNNATNRITPNPQDIQQQQQQQLVQQQNTILNEEQRTVFRGTDIHVRTVELAFKDFLQNFISLEESESAMRKSERHKRNQTRREKKRMRREARAAAGDNGDGDDNDDNSSLDDDSLSSIDSYVDEDEEKTPMYMDKLRDILLGRRRRKGINGGNQDEDEAMTSSSVIETNACIDLNTLHLYYHSPQCQRLYQQLTMYPGEIIPLMDLIVVREMEALLAQLHFEKNEAETNGDDTSEYLTLHPTNIPVPRVQVRPFHLKSLSHMRALDPQSIDNLLSIRGMVVRTSPIIPDLKVAHFQCTICANSTTVTLERGRVTEPTVCQMCNIKNGYELVHNRSLYADKQMVRIQETPNEVPPGETPASIVLFAYDDLVDAVRPGDRVEVTGVFRAQGRRVNPKISKVKSVYKTYLDVVHFRRVSGDEHHSSVDVNDEGGGEEEENETGPQGKGIAIENIGGKLSKKRIEQLENLAKSPDIYEKLVKSLAPSIWELDNVKKGILCMLFGGNSKKVKKGTALRKKMLEQERARRRQEDSDYDSDEEIDIDEDLNNDDDTSKLNKRGDINILLCGDPGTSKSQLLSYVNKLAPRGVYTSGKGTSAVGLTASVVRDPETKDLVLESGALVLSDLGICCIDEFDKMSDTTRAILHEAMEQQTVSIAKAGIIATLNARTSILASANPVESRYNPQLSVVDNIKLPPTLLSRFDLIYLILDAPNVDGDRRLAQHLVGLYYETPNVVQPPLDQNLLRDYISYARDNIFPELSDLATRELISAYLEMRKMGVTSGNGSRTISATPRQLESLIRLSEGLAKMRYSRVVERADVKEAVRLMKVATQAAATDPRTGRIDMDMITTGRSTANREMEEALNLSLKELLAEVSIVIISTAIIGSSVTNLEGSFSSHRGVEIEWL